MCFLVLVILLLNFPEPRCWVHIALSTVRIWTARLKESVPSKRIEIIQVANEMLVKPFRPICLFIKPSKSYSFTQPSSRNRPTWGLLYAGCILVPARGESDGSVFWELPWQGESWSQTVQTLGRAERGCRRERGLESVMEGFLEEVTFELRAETRWRKGKPAWCLGPAQKAGQADRRSSLEVVPRQALGSVQAGRAGRCGAQATWFQMEELGRAGQPCAGDPAGVILSP